ncbi:Peptide chain release factor PrfB2, chloroplastic [Capsicum annuum]|nr:Peptide chain release factor PrfB2, chloroplastic [Capsicum annuum]
MGPTVEGIIAKNWNIVDDTENDWKSHASSIAQSVHLIKKRLKESVKALLRIRRNVKQKELEALLSGEHDCCSCYIECSNISPNKRSQHSNKASALAVLQSRLDQLEMARQAQMNAQHTQSLTEISWGNQISTCVFHPYRIVKDLWTNYEVSDPDSVLEGDLDDFILSFLSSSLDKDEE